MKNKFGFKIIDRYIIRQFLGTFVFAIGMIIVIVVVFDAVEKIDDFIEMKASLYDVAFKYYINFIPFFINQFSGLFTFIAVIYLTSKMADRTEIIAIQSSGVSFVRLLWPYFLSAMAITAFSLLLNLQIIPIANEKRVDFEEQYLKKNRRNKYEPHIYRQIYPNTFAYVRGYSSRNNRASYLFIEKYEGSSIVETLEAADVKLNAYTDRWSAPKYVTRKFDENGKETFTEHEKLDTLINLSEFELGKVENAILTMKYKELNQFISEQKAKGSDMISLFEVERQKRFSYPASVFILTVIGVSLSTRKARQGTGVNIGIGVMLCFTYIMLGRVFEEIAKGSGGSTTIFLVWLPNLVFAVIAFLLYRKAPK